MTRGIAGVLAAVAVLPACAAGAQAAPSPPQRRVVLLGLRPHGNLPKFARQISAPSSPQFRHFVTLPQFRQRFGARPADRRRVLRSLRHRAGVRKVQLSSTRTSVLVVMTPPAARRTFCARGMSPPRRGLCIPRALRPAVRLISAGEQYELGNGGAAS